MTYELNEYAIKLGHLAFIKNKLNNRRQRFYRLMNGDDERWKEVGRRGYEKAKSDMKSMTKEMKVLQKLGNAKLKWDGRGHIYAIWFPDPNKTYYQCEKIGHQNFYRLNEMYLVDNLLLGGNKDAMDTARQFNVAM